MHFGYAIEVAYLAAAASLSIPALLYRANEAQLHVVGVRTRSSRLSALQPLVQGLMKVRTTGG